MTIYLFYHPDTDGITAAAIVRYAARDRWPDARFEYIRHGYLTEDKRLQTLKPDGDTKIFAVDISFHPETTRHLLMTYHLLALSSVKIILRLIFMDAEIFLSKKAHKLLKPFKRQLIDGLKLHKLIPRTYNVRFSRKEIVNLQG